MEDLVKTFFHDKVFFSAEQMQVELKLENGEERLGCENLADEESNVEGRDQTSRLRTSSLQIYRDSFPVLHLFPSLLRGATHRLAT